MKVTEWLSKDPVSFHKAHKEFNLKIDSKVFEILVSKLNTYHFEYFKESLGLNMRINFKGFDTPIKAIVPYTNTPLEFYKWWCENPNEVHMKIKEKLKLFDKVNLIKETALKPQHKRMINK